MEAGVSMFDSADGYSNGMAEEILGKAIKGRRDKVLISTKGSSAAAPGANDVGSSRDYLPRAVEASLRRLGTDYIDLYPLHAFDALTPVEEALGAGGVSVPRGRRARRSREGNRQDSAAGRAQLAARPAVGWKLTADQVKKLDTASALVPAYPYWHQRGTFPERNPPPV